MLSWRNRCPTSALRGTKSVKARYLVKKTIASPSDSKIFSLKFLSVILRSSLDAGTPIGSRFLRNGVVLVTSCPATDDATGGDDFGKNLGMPSNLNASFDDTRNTRERRICKPAIENIFR